LQTTLTTKTTPKTAAEKRRAYQREWEQKNRAPRNEYQREYRKKHPEKQTAESRRRTLKQYGLTPESFNVLLDAQQGKCALCGEPFSTKPGMSPNVDHCHRTNKVRGILHGRCNSSLGIFRDDVTRLLMAVDYLRCSE